MSLVWAMSKDPVSIGLLAVSKDPVSTGLGNV